MNTVVEVKMSLFGGIFWHKVLKCGFLSSRAAGNSIDIIFEIEFSGVMSAAHNILSHGNYKTVLGPCCDIMASVLSMLVLWISPIQDSGSKQVSVLKVWMQYNFLKNCPHGSRDLIYHKIFLQEGYSIKLNFADGAVPGPVYMEKELQHNLFWDLEV